MQSKENQQLTVSTPTHNNDDTMSIKDQLIDMICNDPDLPTLGASIANVVQISSSEDGSTQELANLILSDVALTQKILRLSNAVTFRISSSQVVTSVSTAIQLLGLETIKACALAMIMVSNMPKGDVKYVRYELALALSASLMGRKLAKRCVFPNAEEVAIVALFKNMGRLLVAIFDQKLYSETMALVNNGTHTKAQASMQTIGCNFDTLTERAMQEWKIPKSIISAMKLIPSKTLKPPKNRQEWMQQVTEFSESSALLVLKEDQSTESTEDNSNEALLNRFGTVLHLNQDQLDTLIADVASETRELSNNAQLTPACNDNDGTSSTNVNADEDSDSEEDLLNGLLFESVDSGSSQTAQYHPSGKPLNAYNQLLTGVQLLTEKTATTEPKIKELVQQVLEILYSSLGFHFATVCLKDVKTNQYRARNALGKNAAAIQKHFVVSGTSSDDMFSLAIKRNVDLSISDATVPKIRSMLPNWHQQLLPKTKSFIILPLIINGKPIGFFYADRQLEAPEGISSEEMKLIKTLKGLLLTALSS